MRSRAAVLTALVALAGCSDAPRDAEIERSAVLLVAPEDADATTEALLDEAARYLEAVAGEAPTIVRTDPRGLDQVREIAEGARAPVVMVLDAAEFAPRRLDEPRMEALGESGFVLDAFEDGAWRASDEQFGAAFMLLDGNTALSRQYALYEALRRLGVRFFHPEEEFVPAHAIADLRPLALRPTALHKDGLDYLPDYAWRSWSFHSSHPLEHLESFSDGDVPIDEARNVNAWVVKNRGNRFRGAGRGVASDDAKQRRRDEMEAMRVEMGFPRGTGITLHNEQQGASAEIDPSRDEPIQEQIEALVARKLEEFPDARYFGIHFGPTEFTTTPDEQTVQWINWAGGKALELRPDIEVLINVHITGTQPAPNFDDQGCPPGTNDEGRSDYYDLAFHTDPRLGTSVHTVMFYPVEGQARVYNQQTFAHKLCLMQKASAEGRPLTWFPEGSWWLSFDNSIPVYLPLYLWTRERDSVLMKDMLESRGRGTLRGFRMFNSGHEWGYWQQDYGVGLWAWNADVPMEAVLGEMFDPLCEPSALEGCDARTEATIVMEELMDHQREFFLERADWEGRVGGLYTYFAGEDQADEIAAASGFEFRPVKVPFDTVSGWGEELLEPFEASDVVALEEAATLNHAWADRLDALVPTVPEPGLPWLEEVIDGVRINALRADQTAALYRAAIEYRRGGIAGLDDPAAAAQSHLDAAADALAEAEAVVRKREAAYRYPAEQVYGGGITPETSVPNGTTYGYRVHTKTHLLTYWHNRQDQVATILAGGSLDDAQTVRIEDALAAPGTELTVSWPDVPGLSGTIGVGDLEVGPQDDRIELGDDEGWWAIDGELSTDGPSLFVVGGAARAEVRAQTPASGVTLLEPEDPLAQAALAFVFPALRWGWLPDEPGLAVGSDPNGDGVIAYDDLVLARLASGDASGFTTEPVGLTIPVERSGGTSLQVRLVDATLEGSVVRGALADPVVISGQIRVDDLVVAMIEVGGFDEAGALSTLAGILGFDPADPPATVPFRGEFEIEPESP
ncbi:MAG: hypothetical protein AAGA54_01710 [Myxococcota bacterium]